MASKLKKSSRMVIVDFGSQTAHTIGRRLRQLGVEVTFVEPAKAYIHLQKFRAQGIVLSGGPASVFEDGAPTIDKNVFKLGIPILGICYGV